MKITIVYESWRPPPLAWIHHAEACAVAEELRRAGHTVRLVRYREDATPNLSSETLLLRVSDPVMLTAVRMLTRAAMPFLGPSAAAMERCYDKYEAYRIAAASGVDSSATALASDAGPLPFPLIFKPRQSRGYQSRRTVAHVVG